MEEDRANYNSPSEPVIANEQRTQEMAKEDSDASKSSTSLNSIEIPPTITRDDKEGNQNIKIHSDTIISEEAKEIGIAKEDGSSNTSSSLNSLESPFPTTVLDEERIQITKINADEELDTAKVDSEVPNSYPSLNSLINMALDSSNLTKFSGGEKFSDFSLNTAPSLDTPSPTSDYDNPTEIAETNEEAPTTPSSSSPCPTIIESQEVKNTSNLAMGTVSLDSPSSAVFEKARSPSPTPEEKISRMFSDITQMEETESINPTNAIQNGFTNNPVEVTTQIEEPLLNNKEIPKSFKSVDRVDKGPPSELIKLLLRNYNKAITIEGSTYKVDECNLVFSCVNSDKNKNEEKCIAKIKDNDIHCPNQKVKRFLEESIVDQKMQSKNVHVTETMEYVEGPSTSNTFKPVVNAPLLAYASQILSGSPMNTNILTMTPFMQETLKKFERKSDGAVVVVPLPSELAKNIRYEHKIATGSSSKGQKGTAENFPTISGMKTLPLRMPPKQEVVGFFLAAPESKCIYYHAKSKRLVEVLRHFKTTPEGLGESLMKNQLVSNFVSSKEQSDDSSLGTPEERKTTKNSFSNNGGRNNLGEQFERDDDAIVKPVNVKVDCPCGRKLSLNTKKSSKNGNQYDVAVIEPEPKMVVKESKSLPTMVDCDNCLKPYKAGTNHKCLKKKGRGEAKTFICDACDRTFALQAHLSNHKRSHKEYYKQTVLCELCNKRFRKGGEITKHRADFHPELIKDYACDECGEILKTANKLDKHRKLYHPLDDSSNEMEVRCLNCDKNYSSSYYQKVHRKECTATNPQVNTLTNGLEEVAMRKPIAQRSTLEETPVESDDTDTIVEMEVLQEFTQPEVKEDRTEESDFSVGRPRRVRKRRFMNLDAPTSESETEEPARKVAKRSWKEPEAASDDEAEYIGQEELTLNYDEDDMELEDPVEDSELIYHTPQNGSDVIDVQEQYEEFLQRSSSVAYPGSSLNDDENSMDDEEMYVEELLGYQS